MGTLELLEQHGRLKLGRRLLLPVRHQLYSQHQPPSPHIPNY